MVVTKLGSSETVGEAEVEATNWMGALRGAREKLGESGSIPPGASCNVSPDGGATLLDPISRRRFELTPLSAAALAPQPGASAVPSPDAPAEMPPSSTEQPVAVAPASGAKPSKKAKFQTVAYVPGMALPGMPPPGDTETAATRPGAAPGPVPGSPPTSPAPEESAPVPAAVRPPKKKRFETVAFSDGVPLPSMPEPTAGPPPMPADEERQVQGAGATPGDSSPPDAKDQGAAARRVPLEEGGGLELLLEINDEPTPDNPLRYRERAFVAPDEMSLSEAEAALRWKLAGLQRELSDLPRGKLVNLAVFDHSWTDRPNRPPIIVLQWRDWRDEITVDFPAAQVAPEQGSGHDDVLMDLFEALHDLAHMSTPAHGLRFAVELLERSVPADATAACLYDINTDELRFVAVGGAGAEAMQGRAIPRTAGLFGQAVRNEDRATVYVDVGLEPSFQADVDGRPDLEARNMLLRPVTHDGHLLGVLQLINRRSSTGFTEQDVHLVNYLAERLGDFLQEAKFRRRSEPPPQPR